MSSTSTDSKISNTPFLNSLYFLNRKIDKNHLILRMLKKLHFKIRILLKCGFQVPTRYIKYYQESTFYSTTKMMKNQLSELTNDPRGKFGSRECQLTRSNGNSIKNTIFIFHFVMPNYYTWLFIMQHIFSSKNYPAWWGYTFSKIG